MAAGTITLNANGTYTFDPVPTYIGEVPVRYTISDPGGLTDNAVLTITVIRTWATRPMPTTTQTSARGTWSKRAICWSTIAIRKATPKR